MAIDTERLILEVRNRVELWDLRDPNYKDRDFKQSAWNDVAKVLIPDFEELPDLEQQTTVKHIQQRWKSARDQYGRYKASVELKKSGSATKSKRRYVFADLLSFLDPVQTLEGVDIQFRINRADQTPAADRRRSDRATSREENKERNEMTAFEREIVTIWKTQLDEDASFFNSLLPTVRTLSLQKKFSFRCQVMRLLAQLASADGELNTSDTERDPLQAAVKLEDTD